MKVLVLGIGNILLHDEGIGVLAIEELEQRFSFPAGVELVDGGTCGMELRDLLCDLEQLIIIDAMKNGGRPGTAYRLDEEGVPAHFRARISPHQLGISDLLATLTLTDSLPSRLVLFGVEPENLGTGLGLSPVVAMGLERVVAAVCEELTRQGLIPEALAPDTGRPAAFWSKRQFTLEGEKEATS